MVWGLKDRKNGTTASKRYRKRVKKQWYKLEMEGA